MPAASPSSSRDLDLIVFGATGFTGKLVAEHLAKSYSSDDEGRKKKKVRYALAGRDAARLEAARAAVAEVAPRAASAEIVAVDPADHAALVRLFSRAKAVISTAGPYHLYGTPIVKAAVVSLFLFREVFFAASELGKRLDLLKKNEKSLVVPSSTQTLSRPEHKKQKQGRRSALLRHYGRALLGRVAARRRETGREGESCRRQSGAFFLLLSSFFLFPLLFLSFLDSQTL